MFIIKNEYKGKGSVISLRFNNDDQLLIDLDTASQAELKMLFEIEHPFVQKVDSKEKPTIKEGGS